MKYALLALSAIVVSISCKADLPNSAAVGDQKLAQHKAYVAGAQDGQAGLFTVDLDEWAVGDFAAIGGLTQIVNQPLGIAALVGADPSILLLGSTPAASESTSLPFAAVDVAVSDRYAAVISKDSLYTYQIKDGKLSRQLARMGFRHLPGLGGMVPSLKRVVFGPADRCLYVVDESTGRIYLFGARSDGSKIYPLVRQYVELGSECKPVDLAFHRDGQRFYTICSSSNLIVSGTYADSTGMLSKRSSLRSTPIGQPGVVTTDLALSVDGRFLYVTNRELGTIGVYVLDAGVSFSFLQFLDLGLPGEMHLLPIDGGVLISHAAAQKIYRAIHTTDMSLQLTDALDIATSGPLNMY